MNFEGMGLPLHSGPKRRDYLTYESRLASFVRWPERVKQKPADLAEAGFFYCGKLTLGIFLYTIHGVLHN